MITKVLDRRLNLTRLLLNTIVSMMIVFFMSIQAIAIESFLWDNFTDEQIVEAIRKAENSVKYPYSIKSIDTKGNKEYARQICLNSVRNGRKRWINAGKPYDLIVFIGLRYCPPSSHILNTHWVKNVKWFLKGGSK